MPTFEVNPSDVHSIEVDPSMVTPHVMAPVYASPGRTPEQFERTEAAIQRNAPTDDKDGFWSSLWQAGGQPLVDLVAAKYHGITTNPMGEVATAAQQMLNPGETLVNMGRGAVDQVRQSGEKVGAQLASGNYAGAAGTVTGSIAPIVAPEAAGGIPRLVSKTAKTATEAATAVAKSPLAGDALGVISPRAKNALDLLKAVKGKAAEAVPAEPMVEAAPAVQVPVKALPARVAVPVIEAPRPQPVIPFDRFKLPPDPFKQRPEYATAYEQMKARKIGAPDAPTLKDSAQKAFEEAKAKPVQGSVVTPETPKGPSDFSEKLRLAVEKMKANGTISADFAFDKTSMNRRFDEGGPSPMVKPVKTKMLTKIDSDSPLASNPTALEIAQQLVKEMGKSSKKGKK